MSALVDEIVIVSDIHLKSCNDSRGEILLGMIERIDPKTVKYFVLLGDIFDFCFAASRYFKRKFQLVGESLSRLCQLGVKVIFFQGNHEFALKEFAWPGVIFVQERSLTLAISGDRKIFLSHGDRIGAPWHYEIFQSFTRSYLFRFLALLCPQSGLDRLCLRISERSRLSSIGRRIPHRRILENISECIENTDVNFAIIGHYHVPYHVEIPSGQEILCLKSWDEPNALGISSKGAVRYGKIGHAAGGERHESQPQSFNPRSQL